MGSSNTQEVKDDWDQPLEAKVCPIDPKLLAGRGS